MQKGHTLHFKCISCGGDVHFSIFDLDSKIPIPCHSCSKQYSFSDPILIRQLKKFEALCCKIHDAEEILGSACVGIDVGEHHIKVPYKLLLTRLSSNLDLTIEGRKIPIAFRIEPGQDPHIAAALEKYLME